MSLKAELELWATALEAYDADEFEKSLELFSAMDPNSRILTNMGLILATVGAHESAVEAFIRATSLDQYLAVAYFQCGVSNFLLGRWEYAATEFDNAWLYLRGNMDIRYEQLGLKFTLHAAEVLFNKGLALLYNGSTEEGMRYLKKAQAAKAIPEHEVIDEAVQYQGDQFTVFSVPVGIIYRPSANKLRNAQAKNFLGKAKLVAASEVAEAFTDFTGANRMKKGLTPNGLLLSAPPPKNENADPSAEVTDPTTDPIRSAALARARSQLIRSISDPAPRPDARSRPNTIVSKSNVSESGGVLRRPAEVQARAKVTNWVSAVQSSPPEARKRDSMMTTKTTKTSAQRRVEKEYYYDYFDSYMTDSSPSPLDSGRATPVNGGPQAIPAEQQLMIPRRKPSKLSLNTPTKPRKPTVVRKAPSRRRAPSIKTYQEDEEGYASFEEDSPEPIRIIVKLHYRDDIRGMALWSDTPFPEFVRMVMNKFGNTYGLGLRFKDEDGGLISLKDETDYELAIETSSVRASPMGSRFERKLEIWCSDL